MERDFHWHTLEDTQHFGRALGELLRGGDLVVLTGDLGAGKTTLTQSIGEALGDRLGQRRLAGPEVSGEHEQVTATE